MNHSKSKKDTQNAPYYQRAAHWGLVYMMCIATASAPRSMK